MEEGNRDCYFSNILYIRRFGKCASFGGEDLESGIWPDNFLHTYIFKLNETRLAIKKYCDSCVRGGGDKILQGVSMQLNTVLYEFMLSVVVSIYCSEDDLRVRNRNMCLSEMPVLSQFKTETISEAANVLAS